MVAGALRETRDGILLDVQVRPGARETRVVGFDAGRKALKVDVAAPPERGRANRALLEYLAGVLGADVTLVRGATSRRKTVAVRGLAVGDAEAALRAVSSTASDP